MLCKYEKCQEPAKSKGFCQSHYKKNHLYGDPGYKHRASVEDGLDFISKAIRHQDSDNCLIYPYGKQGAGYGSIRIAGKQTLVHRIVCEAVNGDVTKDKPFALHNCGNGHLGCCNPHHLRWGTFSENMYDKYAN